MQGELPAGISILGINQHGYDLGNESFCNGKDLPWLQDVADVDAWYLFDVEYRDVVVLDGENTIIAYYNLSLNDISKKEAYDELYDLLTWTAEQ